MKHYQRPLVSLYSFLTALLSLLVLFIALGWQAPLDNLQAILANQQTRWIIAAIAIMIFLLAVKLLFDSFQRKKIIQASIQTTAMGEVNITLDALENMINKSVQTLNGVYNIKPKIKCVPEGIAVFVKVQLAPEINIPEITTKIQEAIKDYLETYAGIKLLEARVLVEHSSSEIKARVE